MIHYHWPRAYRYRVAHPGLRAMRNKYTGYRAIGLAVVVGRYAYCLKWAALGTASCEERTH